MVEVARLPAEVLHQIAPGGGGGQGYSGAQRLAHADDVGLYPLDLITPPVAGAAKTGLDLVADEQAPGSAHQPGDFRQEPVRNRWQALVCEERTEQQAGERHSVPLETGDGRLHLAEVVAERIVIGIDLVEPEQIGKRHRAHVARLRARVVQTPDLGAVAVVGGVRADDALTAGGGARHHQCHLVGFGARAAEDHALYAAVVRCQQALAVLEDGLVQVAVVHVQRGELLRYCLHNVRMAVADARDVVVHVHVAPAVCCVEVHALPAHDVHGLLVEQGGAGAEHRVPSGLHVSHRWPAGQPASAARLAFNAPSALLLAFLMVSIEGGSRLMSPSSASTTCTSSWALIPFMSSSQRRTFGKGSKS